MVSKLENALFFQQQALGLRAHRQQVLAANIANSDTPNYKARDVNFKDALHGALAGRVGQPLALSASSSRHLGGQSVAAPAGVLYRPEQQASVDGNTVDMDVERASFAANALQYEASITFINGMLRTMQTAIQGQ